MLRHLVGINGTNVGMEHGDLVRLYKKEHDVMVKSNYKKSNSTGTSNL